MASALSARKRRAAKADAKGRNNREIARAGGLTSKRARLGITVAEWRKDPAYRAMVEKYAEADMTGPEWEARNAAQARMTIPSRVETDGNGHVVRIIYDTDKPMERQAKALGKFKDPAEQPIPPGSALGAFLGVEPNKLATLAEAAAAVLRSVPKGE